MHDHKQQNRVSRLIAIIAAIAAVRSAELRAQTHIASAAFEVASIRPHRGSAFRNGPLTISSPLIRLEGYTVFGLVMDAYDLKDYQLRFGRVAAPEEIYGTMYDIVARAPGDNVPRIGDVRAMLRTLLADRFKLAVHRESREMPVFALVTEKSGPKLTASRAGGECAVHTTLASDGRNDEETFSNCPIEQLANRLGHFVDGGPVLDRTGLTGTYDIRLVAIPAYRTRAQPDPADIFTISAIRELGLKLVPQKAAVDIVAVDRLERPTEN